MKNRFTGRLGRLFNAVIPGVAARGIPGSVVALHAVTLEGRCPGSVVINKESGRDPGLRHSRMTLFHKGKECAGRAGLFCKGFTLIELLVVVLIIGILSAIALPQYQKAVEKSRAAEALINLRAIVNAMQISKMANGEPARKLEDLAISLPGEKIDDRTVKLKNFTYDIRNFGEGTEKFEVVATRNDATADVRKYYIYFSLNGYWTCVATTEAAQVPCSAVCAAGATNRTGEGWWSCRIK